MSFLCLLDETRSEKDDESVAECYRPRNVAADGWHGQHHEHGTADAKRRDGRHGWHDGADVENVNQIKSQSNKKSTNMLKSIKKQVKLDDESHSPRVASRSSGEKKFLQNEEVANVTKKINSHEPICHSSVPMFSILFLLMLVVHCCPMM